MLILFLRDLWLPRLSIRKSNAAPVILLGFCFSKQQAACHQNLTLTQTFIRSASFATA